MPQKFPVTHSPFKSPDWSKWGKFDLASNHRSTLIEDPHKLSGRISLSLSLSLTLTHTHTHTTDRETHSRLISCLWGLTPTPAQMYTHTILRYLMNIHAHIHTHAITSTHTHTHTHSLNHITSHQLTRTHTHAITSTHTHTHMQLRLRLTHKQTEKSILWQAFTPFSFLHSFLALTPSSS